MTALRLEIDALSSVSATEAKAYTEKVQSIIQDHMLHEFELGISMVYSILIFPIETTIFFFQLKKLLKINRYLFLLSTLQSVGVSES